MSKHKLSQFGGIRPARSDEPSYQESPTKFHSKKLNLQPSHEIKRHILLGRKVMTNLDNVLKSRDITLSTKVHLVRAMVFPVVMYGCESWTIKKAERQRTDAFELWCWRRLLRVPWTARRSNQSILKEIGPEYSLEGNMLKLKLHYFGHLMQRTDSFEKTLIVYMLECHSPKSSHPLPLPLSPKVHYTQLCLFSCLAYRVVIAIFLNSIYMC